MISTTFADTEPRIDIRDLARRGNIWPGSETCHVSTERVRVTWTSCALGGQRPWFRCPKCSKRVAILYKGGRLRCRTCSALRYSTQHMKLDDRLAARVRRLEWDYLGIWPTKPKGRHNRTQERWESAVKFLEHARESIFINRLRRFCGEAGDSTDTLELAAYGRSLALAGHRRRSRTRGQSFGES